MRSLILGTRGSPLALVQARKVSELLKKKEKSKIEIKTIKTRGDLNRKIPLGEPGTIGLFTKELDNAILSREIDFAVHSLKDVPTSTPKDLILASVPERISHFDCLISKGKELLQLPAGARIGTSSIRRKAELLHLRPDLGFSPLRGNLETRIAKAKDFDGIIIAEAGLLRLKPSIPRELSITRLTPDSIMPCPGQGALAVVCLKEDMSLREILTQIQDQKARAAIEAERALLKMCGYGCAVPVGAIATLKEKKLKLKAAITAPDGKKSIRMEQTGSPDDAIHLGETLAERLLGEGQEILARCV
ncbi:MAG: hydroxymethylbilane synthase [Candidatus Heimdallarchaeota archaeon]